MRITVLANSYVMYCVLCIDILENEAGDRALDSLSNMESTAVVGLGLKSWVLDSTPTAPEDCPRLKKAHPNTVDLPCAQQPLDAQVEMQAPRTLLGSV